MNTGILMQLKSMYILLFQLRAIDIICHPCGQRADRQASRHVESNVRQTDTQASCFYPGCLSEQRLRVPTWLRDYLFMEYNYYVPKGCRICHFHLNNDVFHELRNQVEKKTFTLTILIKWMFILSITGLA